MTKSTRRWPLSVFFTILNIGAINAYIIYEINTGANNPRSVYLKKLSLELIRGHVRRRLNVQQTPRDIKRRIEELFPPRAGEPMPEARDREAPDGKCFYCHPSLNRKTVTPCERCARLICGSDHRTVLCKRCADEQ